MNEICPVLHVIIETLRLYWQDEDSARLLPLVHRLGGSAVGPEAMRRRAEWLINHVARVLVPAALDAAGWSRLGSRLRNASAATFSPGFLQLTVDVENEARVRNIQVMRDVTRDPARSTVVPTAAYGACNYLLWSLRGAAEFSELPAKVVFGAATAAHAAARTVHTAETPEQRAEIVQTTLSMIEQCFDIT